MNSAIVLPVAVPLAAALAALVWRRRASSVGVLAGVANLAAAMLLLWLVASQGTVTHALGGWEPGLGILLRVDPLAAALLAMCALVALGAGISAAGYFTDTEKLANFWPLWLLLLTALNALLLSADLFNLYVGLELLGLAAVALTALGGGAQAVRAALRYLIVGLLASMVFLAGVVVVYAHYGTLDLIALGEAVRAEPQAWLALALISAGLLVKSALFPLHFWLPPAHANAPAPVSAALSALVVKIAFYLMLRLWFEVFAPTVTPAATALLGLLGAGAVLWGSWNALWAERLKVLAAYSTVAQLGYLFLFFPILAALPPGTARDTAFGALLLLALTHGFAKSALFIAAGSIRKAFGHDRIAELGGTARALPVTTSTLALAGVALIGLPPSGAFLAKWQLLSSAFALEQWLFVAVVAAGSLMAAGYVFRVLAAAFANDQNITPRKMDLRTELPAMAMAITATAILGLGAMWVWDFLTPTVALSEALS